ncbi:MAG: helix-turn-helix domain-containing protein [Deltaproteobacteria bacterium]|nr:helix-turn-helix domain-containing protein [Deltaproteobacteria bacterium]
MDTPQLFTTNSLYSQFLDPDSLLSEAQASELLGVTPRCLQAWRQRGGGPQFVRVSSRCVRYRRRDLIAWAQARLRSSTSEHAAR